MLINFGALARPTSSATSAATCATCTNPSIDHHQSGGKRSLAARHPVLRAHGLLILVVGAIYYVVAVRGREVEVEADAATGEAVIG